MAGGWSGGKKGGLGRVGRGRGLAPGGASSTSNQWPVLAGGATCQLAKFGRLDTFTIVCLENLPQFVKLKCYPPTQKSEAKANYDLSLCRSDSSQS